MTAVPVNSERTRIFDKLVDLQSVVDGDFEDGALDPFDPGELRLINVSISYSVVSNGGRLDKIIFPLYENGMAFINLEVNSMTPGVNASLPTSKIATIISNEIQSKIAGVLIYIDRNISEDIGIFRFKASVKIIRGRIFGILPVIKSDEYSAICIFSINSWTENDG